MTDAHLEKAAQLVKSGGVIAYPTEAVWGLGCDPFNEQAVNKILTLKQRDIKQGLILIAADIQQFADFLTAITEAEYNHLANIWPSHTTFLVRCNSKVPSWITGKHNSVALRVSDHYPVKSLCNKIGILVSTSANPHGQPSATSQTMLDAYFGKEIDYIYPGNLGDSNSVSRIIDLHTGKVLR